MSKKLALIAVIILLVTILVFFKKPATERQAQAEPSITESAKKEWERMFATQIVFYGKVIDEKKNPIEGANVLLSPTQTPTGENNPKLEKLTDRNGLFSIKTHGMGLVVMVSKEGYYQLKESSGDFDYVDLGSTSANIKSPHPNASDPAIFVLKKMGHPDALVNFEKSFSISKNGNPVQVDLVTSLETKDGSNIIKVEAWTFDQNITDPNSNLPYNWSCRITVPGGGLIRKSGEFNFEAPAEGYQASDEIAMPAILGKEWRSQVPQSYFIKLGSGKYARIDFTMSAGGSHFFAINSYLNPSGSRNLEYDPKKELKWDEELGKLAPILTE